MKFPSKVETNSGGGSSLYQAAAQHSSLGQESWAALRKYCHSKMAEWWQWYQPYYTFPLQVRHITLLSLLQCGFSDSVHVTQPISVTWYVTLTLSSGLLYFI